MTMREKLIEILTSFYGVDPMYFGVEAQALADHLIANGVEIPVRCKDCKHCTEIGLPRCRRIRRNILDDDFCSEGERRGGE